MARLYERRPIRRHTPQVPCEPYPGFRLSEVIDQFFEQGVVPDFLPADLGEDKIDEFDKDGWPIVDPNGNIRVDPMTRRENALMAGVEDPDPAPVPTPPVVPPVEPPVE